MYRVNIKSSPTTTFVDISAMREDFCMKFYTTVKQSNIHFLTKFGWNSLQNDKLMLFQPRQLPISQHSDSYLHRSVGDWKEPVCWWWDEDADLQTNRVIADARSDHQWQPQPWAPAGMGKGGGTCPPWKCCKIFCALSVIVKRRGLSLIHIWRCRRSTLCRSRWSPYH